MRASQVADGDIALVTGVWIAAREDRLTATCRCLTALISAHINSLKL